jgi:hypothetical protein
MQAELETALETAVQSGGMPVPPDLPVTPEPPEPPVPPEPPAEPAAPAPEHSVPATEPAAELLSETATAPAPESNPQPSAPSGPTNINVDIRILSPGDDGDVVQEIGDVIQEIEFPGAPMSGGAPSGADERFTWNWIWNWESGCATNARAASTWNWVWEWEGECAGEPGFTDVPDVPDVQDVLDFSSDVPGLAGEPQEPAESVAEQDVEPAWHESLARPRRAPLAVAGVSYESAPGTLQPPAGFEAGSPAFASATNPPRTSVPEDDPSAPAPLESPAPPMPLAAAASAPAGSGFPVPVAIALLALLCLLVPRALEPAFPTSQKLSSLLSSSRLERPG